MNFVLYIIVGIIILVCSFVNSMFSGPWVNIFFALTIFIQAAIGWHLISCAFAVVYYREIRYPYGFINKPAIKRYWIFVAGLAFSLALVYRSWMDAPALLRSSVGLAILASYVFYFEWRCQDYARRKLPDKAMPAAV